jgi:surface carbohydrate biosynthesis protein
MVGNFKILCFVDNDYGRDVELLLPFVYFIEKHLKCEVEFVFVWDIFAIYRKKPDLILLPNTVGSYWYFEASKYAYEQGVKVFALISEGNFRTDGTFDYWGYNYDKKFYQEYICLWSKRTYDFLSKELPDYKDKMVFTGATGFDRYLLCNFKSKEEFLNKKKLHHFKKVIGYAGWAFGKLYYDTGRKEIVEAFGTEAEFRMKWMEEQMYLIESILRKSIENNPDILFILVKHPNETHPHVTKHFMNEMVRLKDYDNVLYITEKENIHDLINISDIWLGFESTTAIEAWLLQKTTILINPDPDFKRDTLYKGSVIVKSYHALQEYYTTGKIKAFKVEEKLIQRRGIIADTIGFDDGLNHLRTGYYLKKVLEDIPLPLEKHFRFSIKYFKRYLGLWIGRYFYLKSVFIKLPKFRKTIWLFDRYRLKQLPLLKSEAYNHLDDFYKENKLDEKVQQKEFWDKILSK